MIGRPGSLARDTAANPEKLREARGMEEAARAAISATRHLCEAALDENPVRAPVNAGDPSLHRYLRSRLAAGGIERLHAVYCDSGRGYLADETICEGTSGRIVARARPLIERALALGAEGILLAHNHPSGICRPSGEDIAATRRIRNIAAALEIELVDHLIVTLRSVYSMRMGGCF